ncbi:MAG: nitroreductase [Emcibacteraceae bacterium]|uniref:nitroreductase family protein n=1 Tax=Pseudemcibacter sp. TaxID=2943293 RepID=UPI003F6A2DF1|nr:nitroreductase [Emcibacteraceae bacterium]MDG1725749.1 nitroreductase [Emcibacteraceae bacterium]
MTLLNKSPEMCERLAAANPSEEMLTILLRRRSLTVKDMIGPGPSQDEIDLILTIGSRVPDHKKQVPWRFLTIEGDARHKAGEKLRSIFVKNNPDTDNDLLDFEQNLLTRAPLVIAVISTATPDNPKVPEWEQILTAGAVCQNILLASNALGFAGQWLSEWYAYDDEFLAHLGLSKDERIAGFIYIGTAGKEPAERGRPDIKELTQKWQG